MQALVMSQLEEADDFYAAGRKLAEYIANSNGKEVSTATLQALIRDFLPQHEDAQEALRSIAARADFLKLVQLAGSGLGVAQKCAFIESLRKIYSAETTIATDRLVCGILLLPPSASLRTINEPSQSKETFYGSAEKTTKAEDTSSITHHAEEINSETSAAYHKPTESEAGNNESSGVGAGEHIKDAKILKPNKNRRLALGAALTALLGTYAYWHFTAAKRSQMQNTPPNHLTSESAAVIHLSPASKKGWYTRHTQLPFIVFSLAETDKTARANAEMKCIDRTMWMIRGGGRGGCELKQLKRGFISVASSYTKNVYGMPKFIGYSTGARTREEARTDALTKCQKSDAGANGAPSQCSVTFDYQY